MLFSTTSALLVTLASIAHGLAFEHEVWGHGLWTNWEVPYVIDPAIPPKDVLEGMRRWSERTNGQLKFVERTDQPDFVRFVPGTGCHAEVGRKGGEQEITLAPGCYNNPILVAHEVGHMLGIGHEHQRPDRDDFIDVNLENVEDQFQFAFRKQNLIIMTEYDFASSLHYTQTTFDKDEASGFTIESKVPGKQIPSVQLDISDLDTWGFCAMYGISGCKYEDPTLEQRLGTTGNGKTVVTPATPSVVVTDGITNTNTGTTTTGGTTTSGSSIGGIIGPVVIGTGGVITTTGDVTKDPLRDENFVKCVFNARRYGLFYKDLQAVFGSNRSRLASHFREFGIKEGRTPCGFRNPTCRFDALVYESFNPDLKAQFQGNVEALTNHYLTFGMNEKRRVC